jgi:uncharacterized protein YndB with AHSA1/START domain
MSNPDFQTSLHLRHTFAATPEQVFRAWTEPKALEQWFRPMGLRVTVVILDLRVGGEYRFQLHHQEDEHSSITGTYLEITPPTRLAFTWITEATHGEQTIVTLDFVEHCGLTEVHLTHDRLLDEATVLTHRTGWESCIDRIADVL